MEMSSGFTFSWSLQSGGGNTTDFCYICKNAVLNIYNENITNCRPGGKQRWFYQLTVRSLLDIKSKSPLFPGAGMWLQMTSA